MRADKYGTQAWEYTMSRTTHLMAAGAITIALSGCDTRTPDMLPTEQPTRSQLSSSTSSPADLARERAVTAYRGMWHDFAVAGRTSDWQSSTLGQHATGTALNNLSRGLYSDHHRGLVTKGEPTLSPTVSTMEPADDPKKIVVTDCGDSTNWLKYRADNGQLADDRPGGRHQINAVVERQTDGSWKVSDYGVHDVGKC